MRKEYEKRKKCTIFSADMIAFVNELAQLVSSRRDCSKRRGRAISGYRTGLTRLIIPILATYRAERQKVRLLFHARPAPRNFALQFAVEKFKPTASAHARETPLVRYQSTNGTGV